MDSRACRPEGVVLMAGRWKNRRQPGFKSAAGKMARATSGAEGMTKRTQALPGDDDARFTEGVRYMQPEGIRQHAETVHPGSQSLLATPNGRACIHQ